MRFFENDKGYYGSQLLHSLKVIVINRWTIAKNHLSFEYVQKLILFLVVFLVYYFHLILAISLGWIYFSVNNLIEMIVYLGALYVQETHSKMNQTPSCLLSWFFIWEAYFSLEMMSWKILNKEFSRNISSFFSLCAMVIDLPHFHSIRKIQDNQMLYS